MLLWHELHEAARQLVAGASGSVVIVAPFIKRAALQHVLAVLPKGVTLSVYTRWRAEEVARGVSDTSILSDVELSGGKVWLIDELHAKLVLVGDARALVGSANITSAGLGLAAWPNFEMMTEIVVPPSTVALLHAELNSRRRVATPEEAAAVEAAANVLGRQTPNDPDAQRHREPSTATQWMPAFRSPDRIFYVYEDSGWLASAQSTDPAVADILALRLPAGLTRMEFNALVRRRLLETPAVRELEAALTEPQRFGALTHRLRRVLPGASHAQRQATLQVLLRWLLYFAEDRFRMETPNYSEIVSLR